MKELTIEQKAKRYDKALEKARNFELPEYQRIMEELFPELRESEDEKVRKEIISFLKDHIDDINLQVSGDYDTRDKEDIALQEWCKRAIAWLEKQGDNNNEDADILQRFSFYSYKDEPNVLYLSNVFVNEEYRNKGIGTKILKIADEVSIYLKCNSIRLKTENGSNAESLYRKNGYKTLKEEGNQIWLEKQGDLKSDEWKEGDVVRHGGVLALVTNGRRAIKSNLEQITIQYPDEWIKAETKERKYFFDELEKQDKQQPADKIEPKFKVGDWIVCEAGECTSTLQITDIKSGYYWFHDDSYLPVVDEDCLHLWTIVDAKDGDVLADKYNNIGIYQGDKNAVTWNSYCYCGVNKRFYSEGCHEFPCYPATKEQRDQLEKAIVDAGYTFDFGKKELKKIERKPQRMISAEVKEALYDKPTDEEMKELLRTEYEKGRADTLSEMKSSWSEEDEGYIDTLIGIMNERMNCSDEGTMVYNTYKKTQDWVKSLKDRVQPQPKQKWSEEDEKRINRIIIYLESANVIDTDILDDDVDWLKSLKQRIGG